MKLRRKYSEYGLEKPAPTVWLNTLKKWSSKFSWVARAEQYDAEETERIKNERRHEALNSGLALEYERVHALKEIADKILKLLNDGLDVPTKMKAGFDILTVQAYADKQISDLRGILDDLAKETGGRVNRHEVELPGVIKVTRKSVQENNE